MGGTNEDGKRLVLFDIDGTLLSAGKASRRALVLALTEVFGSAGPVDAYEYSGKTDPQIVRELMTADGFDGKEVDARMPQALALYRAALEKMIRPEEVREKPGVTRLVRRLADDPRATLALLTGNLEPCARIKLGPLDLNALFPFGAYGSDHADRYRLPAIAVRRADELLGVRFEGKRVVVVGDSIHDVRCGRSIGVRAVAVATGPTPRGILAAEAPDALVDDFSDTEASVEAILGGD